MSLLLCQQEESVAQPKRSLSKVLFCVFGFLQSQVEQLLPCIVSPDYKFKAANFEGFTLPQKAKFSPSLSCIEFLHSPCDGDGNNFGGDFTPHKVNVRVGNDNRVGPTCTGRVTYLNSHELSGWLGFCLILSSRHLHNVRSGWQAPCTQLDGSSSWRLGRN